MKIYSKIIAFALVLPLATGCVSQKKYKRLAAERSRLQSDSIAMKNDIANRQQENVRLSTDLGRARNDLNVRNAQIQNLNKNSELAKMTIEEQQRRLNLLTDLIQRQAQVMQNLKSSVANALINFNPGDLSVTIKNGKIYVSLQEKLLFASGSAQVDPKGKDALGKLASVLQQNPDINVQIECHTDTVPIHNKSFSDNWDLSVGRAVSIVRILTKEYGMNGERITTSGRAQYVPVASNRTVEGRTLNRRAEIILSPKLDELYQLLGEQ